MSPGFDPIARQTILRVTVRAGAVAVRSSWMGYGAGYLWMQCWTIISRANNMPFYSATHVTVTTYMSPRLCWLNHTAGQHVDGSGS